MTAGARQVSGLRIAQDHSTVDKGACVSRLIHGRHIEIAEYFFCGKLPQLFKGFFVGSIHSNAACELDADRLSRRGPVWQAGVEVALSAKMVRPPPDSIIALENNPCDRGDVSNMLTENPPADSPRP